MTDAERKHAITYLDDLYDSDPGLPLHNAILLVALDAGCSDQEAYDVVQDWLKERAAAPVM